MLQTLGIITAVIAVVVAIFYIGKWIGNFMGALDEAFTARPLHMFRETRTYAFFSKNAKFAAKWKRRYGVQKVKTAALLASVGVLVFGAWAFSGSISPYRSALHAFELLFFVFMFGLRPFFLRTSFDHEEKPTNDNDTEHNTLTHNR